MADFAAVLKKTIDGLKENTPEMRGRVYDKARATIEAKLAAVSPPPPAALADRQRRHLEDAIAAVEAEYALPPEPEPEIVAEEEDGLDRLLADLDPRTIRPAPATLPPLVGVEPQPVAHGADAADWHRLDHVAESAAEPWQPQPVERMPRQPRRARRSYKGLVATLVILVLVAAAGAVGWVNRDNFDDLPGYRQLVSLFADKDTQQAANGNSGNGSASQSGAASSSNDNAAADGGSGEAANGTDAGEGEAPKVATAEAPAEKFTQRLTESGEEVDEGPAKGESSVGEGTSVAEASEATAAQAGAAGAPAAATGAPADTAAGSQQVPVGQKAIFYEERTNAAEGSAETGNVVWSLVQESPGDDLPPEAAIRGEATIPGKNLQLRITIKRNADKSLPASHIVEMIFLTPDDFPGGGIDNVLRISMKQSEQDTGNPLLGIPAKIADGFFLFALNDSKAEEQTNLLLMKRQEWIDIPLVYKSGRRALITMEKGIPGDKVFDEALEAWSKESSG